ncbi:DUF6148 family protein [Thermaerobacillus caldiproteolyticus]|uniref:DUF6148 family protein n=1 Tax=Thermaerobacillus caldiproteolyticus TaxID=247480 RepID=UPI001E3C1D12|nr:DUF6148 family protein [Anoxybacillus caldiproteolyticus]
MSITLEQAEQQLNAWLAANLAVSTGQSYRIGNRQLERADAAEILRQINFWRREVERLRSGRRGVRVFRAVPMD